MPTFLRVLYLSVLLTACTASARPAHKPDTASIRSWQQGELHSGQSFDNNLRQLQQWLSQSEQGLPDNLDSSLLYLRYFSYYSDTAQLPAASLLQLHQLLQQLAAQPRFSQANHTGWRLQEHYAVLLYRYYPNSALTAHWPQQLQALLPPLQQLQLGADLQQHYSWWEISRSLAFAAVSARNQAELKPPLAAAAIDDTLLSLLPHSQGWQLEHIVWALAYYHILLEPAAQQALDKQVLAALSSHPALQDQHQYRQIFSRYLANSFRVREQCEAEFAPHCLVPDIEPALPLRHQCHERLVIRARTIAPAQLESSCQNMMAQEARFHQLLNTGQQPVANDFNHTLEVVIFDDYSDYNLYGSLYFNIRSNNGGMYIEGTPSDPANQARFFSFQRFWQPQPFAVWNLEHEYIHYLDGRFAGYGPFGHFPSHLVWWSEGLAELLSQPEQNRLALAMLQKTATADLPSLQQIFAASYADGLDLTYRWSWFAWRYLQQHKPEQLAQLAGLLRQDFFAGYLALLQQLADSEQAAFSQYLALQAKQPLPAPGGTTYPLGRYLYRSYLQPGQLPISERHFHLLQQTEPQQ